MPTTPPAGDNGSFLLVEATVC